MSARFSHKQFGPGSHFPGARKGVVDVRMEGIPGAQVVGDPAPNGKNKKKKTTSSSPVLCYTLLHPSVESQRSVLPSARQWPQSFLRMWRNLRPRLDFQGFTRLLVFTISRRDFLSWWPATTYSVPGKQRRELVTSASRSSSVQQPPENGLLISPLLFGLQLKCWIFIFQLNLNALLDLPHVRHEAAARAI